MSREGERGEIPQQSEEIWNNENVSQIQCEDLYSTLDCSPKVKYIHLNPFPSFKIGVCYYNVSLSFLNYISFPVSHNLNSNELYGLSVINS